MHAHVEHVEGNLNRIDPRTYCPAAFLAARQPILQMGHWAAHLFTYLPIY